MLFQYELSSKKCLRWTYSDFKKHITYPIFDEKRKIIQIWLTFCCLYVLYELKQLKFFPILLLTFNEIYCALTNKRQSWNQFFSIHSLFTLHVAMLWIELIDIMIVIVGFMQVIWLDNKWLLHIYSVMEWAMKFFLVRHIL